jgi:predicted nucleotidyltransferase
MHSLHLLLNRLADAGIDFVVVGGFAGVIHGSALVTWDVDVCASLSAEKEKRIRSALADLKPMDRHPLGRQSLANLQIGTECGFIDIFPAVLGVGDYKRVRERAIVVTMFGRAFAVISMDDLIAAKEAVGREKDLLAVKELRAIAAIRAKQRSGFDEKI